MNSEDRLLELYLKRHSQQHRYFEYGRPDPTSTVAYVKFRLLDDTLRILDPSDFGEDESRAMVAKEKLLLFRRSIEGLRKEVGNDGVEDFALVERDSEQGFLLLDAVMMLDAVVMSMIRLRGDELLKRLEPGETLSWEENKKRMKEKKNAIMTRQQLGLAESDW